MGVLLINTVLLIVMIIVAIVLCVIGVIVGFNLGVAHRKKIAEAEFGSAEEKAKSIVKDAEKAADAKKDGAELLQPTTDTVTYDDVTTEEVNGFDVPVKALDKDFDLALIGTKGKWYDHTVSVTNPVKVD